MVRRGSFIGGQDNLSVPDAPTIGAATAGNAEVSVAFTAPSAVGDDPITSFGVSVFPATGTIKTFRVTVASGNLYGGGTGNVFYIDGVGNPALTLVKGFTYVFDQEDSSNSGHPFHFKNSSDSQYTTGVTVTGTAGQSGSKVTLVLAEDASEPSAYYCTAHGNGMGNTITLVAPSASDDPLGEAQYTNTGSSSPITVTGLSNGTSYVAKVWAINDYGNGPLSDATSSFSPSAPRGIWSGGDAGSKLNVIDYVSIASTGTAQDFGDQTRASAQGASVSSSTRGVMYIGGSTAIGRTNEIDKITIASTGNATDFGDISNNRSTLGGASNDTRGLFMGGTEGAHDDTVDYVTIASDGNASNFGDLTVSRAGPANGTSSSATRVIAAGGSGDSTVNTIDYRDIASIGNFIDFGDLTTTMVYGAAASSSTRVTFASGENAGGTALNSIDFITTASTGNASDFGDIASSAGMGKTGLSSKTIGLFGGGQGPINSIDAITIASAANATDFGDLTVARRFCNGGVSSAHGGIS